MPSRQPDLNPREFRDLVLDNGFAFLSRATDEFIDLRHPRRGRIAAVKDGRTIRRQATLDALLAARGAAEAEKQAAAKARAKLEATAGRIAPTVLAPCRADLTGPAAIAQLADDYLTRFATAGYVGFTDLVQMGWRADQLRQHADAARAVADRRQSREVA